MILPIALIVLAIISMLALGHALNSPRMVKIVGILGITALSLYLLFYALILLSIQHQIEPPWMHSAQEKTFEDVTREMENQE